MPQTPPWRRKTNRTILPKEVAVDGPQDWRPQMTAESTPQKRWGRPPKSQQHSAMKNMHTGRLSKENESEVEEMEMSQSQEEEESKTTTKDNHPTHLQAV